MKYLIEKELCNPQNGNIVHVYSIDDNNNKILLKTFDGDIKETARFAELLKEDYVIESSSYDEETKVVNVNVRINKGIDKIIQTLHITEHE